MTAKHTEGPWIASPYSSVVGAPVVAANGRSVAKVTYYALASEGFANHERESEANGRLIAAAPDMLAALKSLTGIVEEIHSKWDEGMRAGKLLIALMDPSLKYRPDITAIHDAIAKAEGQA